MAPLVSRRLHAFAYLADVLSPVWGLPAFDGKILRLEDGPYYADLQEELDRLVVLGLVEVTDLEYVERGDGGARLEGEYGLRFASERLEAVLSALGAGRREDAIDDRDWHVHEFLVELAGALATLPNREIDRATSADVTYRSKGLGENVVDFGEWAVGGRADNPSWQTADRFEDFLPKDARLTSGEKLFLYADYLGRVVNA